MADLPKINTLLQIVIDDEISFVSRVEDVDGSRLTIAAPSGRGDVEIPADGTEFEVYWTGNRTRFMLVASMAGRSRDRLAHWHLTVVRDPTRRTRRQFVRGGGGGHVRLRILAATPDGAAPPEGPVPPGRAVAGGGAAASGRGAAPGGGAETRAFEGWVVDISEAAARCRLRCDPEEITAGQAVVVGLTLGATVLDVEGTVYSVRGDANGRETDVVVLYEPPERDAQLIRHHVLQWEISQRGRQRPGGPRAVAV